MQPGSVRRETDRRPGDDDRFWRGFIAGALMLGGTVAIIDNVVVHWVLEWHRLVRGSAAGPAETALLLVGLVLVAAGAMVIVRRPRSR